MKILIYILLLFPIASFSQVNIDSLRKVWNDPNQSDTNRLNAVYLLSWKGYLFVDHDSAFYYAQLQYELAEERQIKKMMGSALNTMGAVHYMKGDFDKCIDFFSKSLKIDQEIGDKVDESSMLNNIGIVFQNQGYYDQALDYHSQSLNIRIELGDKRGEASSLSNIGFINEHQGNHELALDYYKQSLEIAEEIDDKIMLANIKSNYALTYQNMEEYEQAILFQRSSLELYQELGNKMGIASSLINLGKLHQLIGDFGKSLEFAEKGWDAAQDAASIEDTEKASELLWKLYKESGNHKKALEMFELFIESRDSIERKENQKAIIQQQYKYEYEKKAAADSIKAMEEDKVQDALLAAEKAEVKQQEQQKYYLFGGLALALLFGGFIFNRFRVTSKQKDIIEEQKKMVEESHREITDSINYAERIQRSFLATKEILDENLKDYFVFFKPKEAVSGDFYWAAELNDGNFAWSVADSTGHGVPGAIMSLLNISSLEKSIETETSPEKILVKTREIIVNRLKKDGSEEGGKDGMDCNLLVINKERSQLTFASAHNPVIIVRGEELIEFKGDKIPVGKHDRDNESFTLQTLQLQKGDVIYALTDGFPDQFGGPKGKKYMIKNLKNKFMEIAGLPMNEQQYILNKEFEDWKQKNEQIDDVCIIGVRV